MINFESEQRIESKGQKAKRLQRELATYRVETLQDAARILGQLDEKLVGRYGNAKLVSIEFLNKMAEAIRKESERADVPSLP